MTKRTLHVVPAGENWQVKEDGKSTFTFGNLGAAEGWARQQKDAEVVVYDTKGKVRDAG